MYKTLKQKLDAEGMSVYALAKKTGIGSNHLYRALGGHITLFQGWKKRIAEALDCSVNELFPNEDSEDSINE